MKFPLWFIVYTWCAFAFGIFVMCAGMSGKISTSYYGFAVDSAGDIYIGKSAKIDVLEPNGKALRTIIPFTSRGYKFTVSENDNLVVSTGDYIYTADLYGNLISKNEIVEFKDNKLYGVNPKKYVAADGTEYIMKSPWFRPTIYKITSTGREEVYKMPAFDYTIKVISIPCFLSLIVVIPVVIVKMRGKENILRILGISKQ